MSDALVSVTDLTVRYRGTDLPAVNAATFQIHRGERVGVVGESGSGKSTLGSAMLRLLAQGGSVDSGSVVFAGTDLLTLSDEQMRARRWSELAIVFQNSMTALNPVRRVGNQIIDAIRLHDKVSRGEAKARVAELFEQVGLDPQRARSYPHELSGGMRQRAVIALALSCNPSFVIADEPTTALDVVVQRQVLDLLSSLQADLGLTLMVITHDLAVVAETCDRILVMTDGVIVEQGSVDEVLTRPQHPYTRKLLASYAQLGIEVETGASHD